MDAKETFSRQMLEEYRKSGIMGLWLPEEYGGLGGGITCLAMAFEELSRVCAGLALTPGTSALGAIPMFWPLPKNSANAGAPIWRAAKTLGVCTHGARSRLRRHRLKNHRH